MSPDHDRVTVDSSLAHLIPFFFENRRSALLEALTFCDAGDMEALHRLGHNFKGACASYGFGYLSDLGAELQRAEDTEYARTLVQRMLDHLDRVEVEYD